MIDLSQLKQKLTNSQLVGLTIYGEARNQSLDGKVAVGCVIRNRLWANEPSSIFGGKTFKDVCLARHQFSCWFESGSNYDELMKSAELVLTGQVYKNVVLKECLYIGQGIVDNQFRDNVNGALYYRTIQLLKEKPVNMIWSIEIGDHVFYKV